MRRDDPWLCLPTPDDNLILFPALSLGSLPLLYFPSFRVIQKAFIDMENMLTLFDVKPEVEDAPDSVEYVNKGGEIKVEKLLFGYNERESVLNDVSFKAGKGQTIALVRNSPSRFIRNHSGWTVWKWKVYNY